MPPTGAPSVGQSRIAFLDRDRSLVEAAQRDPTRFEALYRKYLAQVYSLAFHELGDHHDAEDATERAFLGALGALPRFEERALPVDGDDASTFRIWLFRIARNAIATQRRERARRHGHVGLDSAAGLADGFDLEGRHEAVEAAGTALAALGRLPGDRRRALLMRFVDEMSTAEIAGVLGKSEGAVRVLIHRGLRSIARQLGEPGR